MLNRMDSLATQSANGTYDNEVDRLNLQKEVNALRSEIDRIADSSNFNGKKPVSYTHLQLMEFILSRDAKGALLQLDQLYQGGKDVGAVLGELSTLVRDLLLRRTAPEGGAALLSGGYDSATLDRLGREIPATRLIYLATTLQRATADLYYSSNRRTDAELCLLRLCDESLSGDLTALEARVQRLEDSAQRGQLLRAAAAEDVYKRQAGPRSVPRWIPGCSRIALP